MSEDLIKRSDAINHCETWRDRAKKAKDKEGWWMADNLLKLMKDTPTAEPKCGEWIDEADEIDAFFGIHDYRCSNCNSYADEYIGGHEWYTTGKPNFCPNCGAKMKVIKR